MSRWFRFYDDAINDPKALKLSDKTYRVWVGILCIASKNAGQLPPFEDMAIMLRMKPQKLQPELEKLIAAELIDHDDAGLRPHNWDKRQYKSDVSTERVKRFRNGERNVSETPPETEADTEQNTEKKDTRAVAVAPRPAVAEPFDEFWKAYPRRDGANPKAPARKLFIAALKGGAEAAALIEGARRCATAEHEKVGTPYIPQTVKWLRDRRWEDYAAAGPAASDLSPDAIQQKFAQMRNGGHERLETERTTLLRTGDSPRAIEGPGRQEPTKPADDKTRHGGMVSLGGLFPRASGVHAGGDETSSGGTEPGNDSPRPLARPV